MIIKKDVAEAPNTNKSTSDYKSMSLEELKAAKHTLKIKLYTSKGDTRKDAHNKIVELDSLIASKEKTTTTVDSSNEKKSKGKKTSK
jgi:hypothetical protein